MIAIPQYFSISLQQSCLATFYLLLPSPKLTTLCDYLMKQRPQWLQPFVSKKYYRSIRRLKVRDCPGLHVPSIPFSLTPDSARRSFMSVSQQLFIFRFIDNAMSQAPDSDGLNRRRMSASRSSAFFSALIMHPVGDIVSRLKLSGVVKVSRLSFIASQGILL